MISDTLGPAYELRLSDGEQWFFAGIGGAKPFVEELSRVMGLVYNEDPGRNLMLFQPASMKENTSAYPHAGGWHTIHQDEWQTITVRRSDEDPRLYLTSITEAYLRLPCLPTSVRTLMDVIYAQAASRGGLPIHGGLLERDGKGVVIAASGETGKTTCCRRIPRPWAAHCDDQVLITFDEFLGYRAHPFPNWNDVIIRRQAKHWNCSYSVKLAGIFFLQQAAIDGAACIGSGWAAIRLTDLCVEALDVFYFDSPPSALLKRLRRTLFINAAALTKQVPVFELSASLTGSFWESIADALGME